MMILKCQNALFQDHFGQYAPQNDPEILNLQDLPEMRQFPQIPKGFLRIFGKSKFLRICFDPPFRDSISESEEGEEKSSDEEKEEEIKEEEEEVEEPVFEIILIF